MKTVLKSLTGVTATMLLASYAGAQTINEVEPNNVKSTATAATLTAAGATINGLTTGSSTTGADPANADFFRVKTAPAALGIYRHRLSLTTTGTAGHSGAIMGVGATGTASDTTTVTTSATGTTPARMVQWYGFGKEEEVFYRVTGGTSTTANYVATYATEAVTPINAGSYDQGTFNITTVGQGHSTDTEMFLFDSNLNLLRSNDDEASPSTAFQSRIIQNLTPGTYYLAVGAFNTAMSAALDTVGERSSSGARLDFPNAITCSASTSNQNVTFSITNSQGTQQIAATRASHYDLAWATFTVQAANTPPTGIFGANPSTVNAGESTLLTVNVTPGTVPASTDITVSADLTAVGGSASTALFDDGTNGDAAAGDNIFSLSYVVPGAVSAGVKSVPFTVADAQARSSNGSGTVTVIAPPAFTDLGTLSNGNTSPAAFDLAAGEVRWFKVTVPAVNTGAGNWLDIWTSGPAAGDTEIGVYTATGALEDSDDDDGAGAFSALSYGQTTPTRPLPPDGAAFNGRDGSLAGGTYYVAVGMWNMTFGTTNWGVTSTGGTTTGVQVNFQLGPVSSSPTVTGVAAGGAAGDTILIRGTVVPGAIPASTGIVVNADLTAIGGAAAVALNDAGTGGDAVAGDNVYSASYTLTGATAPGAYTVALSVSDDQARSGSGSLTVNVDDIGQSTSTAFASSGTELLSVSGSLGYANDIDMFRVQVCDPATFSAEVTAAGTLSDTQLFMFRGDGTGVAFNDDSATSGRSKIDGVITQALTPGTYYVAIADYNTDPRDASNNLIWLNSPFTGVRSPDGAGAANPLASWDNGGGDMGTYTIAFTGAGGDACPSTCPGDQCGDQDFNGDGDFGTDADIEAFFACLGGTCCETCFCQGSDFNGDGDFGTDADIEAFFRVLGGGSC